MSTRDDIIDGTDAAKAKKGLVYTEVLGWIDLGHAKGDDKTKLKFTKTVRWRIKKGLPGEEQISIALAMMMKTAHIFETFQSNWFFSWINDSGYSGEDLVSDLLGFYRVVRPKNYFPLFKPVSK